jgi:Predicted flavin-nucleotide-binding protein
MIPMRMYKLECRDTERIYAFLEKARTGFLGLSSGDFPYVVPLNYVWTNGAIYFHGAAEGRKAETMKRNSRVCFTVCEDNGTISAVVPAHTDTAYMSVMLFGAAVQVTDLAEATAAMQAMLDKYVPGYYDLPLSSGHVEKYVSSLGSRTAVYKLTPDAITAKENEASDSGRLFRPGKTQHDEKG